MENKKDVIKERKIKMQNEKLAKQCNEAIKKLMNDIEKSINLLEEHQNKQLKLIEIKREKEKLFLIETNTDNTTRKILIKDKYKEKLFNALIDIVLNR